MKWVCIAFVALAGCGHGERKFDNLAALKADQDKAGFVMLGRFGESWPATVRGESTARNEIEFRLQDGGAHRYPGYTGYTLKVVRLASDSGDEVVVVFRSKQKS